MHHPVAAGCKYRRAQLLRQLPRRACCQDVDIADLGDEAVRQHRGATEDSVVFGVQLERPHGVPRMTGKPDYEMTQRTVTAVPLAETISIPPLLPAVMFS